MKKTKILITALSVAAVCGGLSVLAACKHSHSYSEWETLRAATCTEQGERKRVCGCGEEEKETIPASGHRWGEWQTTEISHKKVCLNDCGEEAETGAHDFNANNVCTTCGHASEYTALLTYAEITAEEDGTVIGYSVTGSEEAVERIVVPAYHEGLPVIAIADKAFSSEEEDPLLKEVTLLPTVKKIGEYAFYNCTGLKKIAMNGVDEIAKGAFYVCSVLEEIDLTGVATIGDYAFCLSGLKEVVLPESLLSIGKQALQQCDYLTTVTIRSAPVFGDYLFYMSGNLKTVIIEHDRVTFGQKQGFSDIKCFYGFAEASVDFIFGNNVTEIAPAAIGTDIDTNASCVKSVKLGTNVTKIGDKAFEGSSITEIELPSSLRSIGREAFYNCEKLKKIVIPEGVETLSNSAFNCCYELEEVSLPKSLKTIEMSVFNKCSAVSKVNYAGTLNDWLQMDIGGAGNPLQYFASFWVNGEEITGELVIDGVETVKKYAFCGINVESIVLGESVTKIEPQAFGQSSDLPIKYFKRIVILNKDFRVANSEVFGYREGQAEQAAEIFYKGTAEQFKKCNLYNLHHLKDCKVYCYSETPETEELPASDSRYTFVGFWKYASDGKTIEKIDRIS